MPADPSPAPSGDCRHFVATTNTSFEGFCFKIICIRSAQHPAHGVCAGEARPARERTRAAAAHGPGERWWRNRRQQVPVICFLTSRAHFAEGLFRQQPAGAQGQEPSPPTLLLGLSSHGRSWCGRRRCRDAEEQGKGNAGVPRRSTSLAKASPGM